MAALLGAPSGAWAQQAPTVDPSSAQGKQAEAKARYERGAQAYADGRYKDAIDMFLQADALAPSAPLSFNIARAYHKIGDGASALQWYRDYRRRAPNAPNAEEVNGIVAGLEQELATKGVMQVTVLSSPLGATVIVDDQPVGVTPYTGQFPPGPHRVVLSLRGYADSERKLELPADRAQLLEVPLLPAAQTKVGPSGNAADSPTPAPVEQVAHRSSGSRFGVVPWVVMGAGAAALGGAAVFELLRRGAEDDAKSAPQVEYQEKYDQMTSRQSTARVLGIAGGVLVLGGGVLLVIDLTSKPERESAKLELFCGVACGASLNGRF